MFGIVQTQIHDLFCVFKMCYLSINIYYDDRRNVYPDNRTSILVRLTNKYVFMSINCVCIIINLLSMIGQITFKILFAIMGNIYFILHMVE